MLILASEGCFWPLAASITSEAKINYAYVTTQDICNNFIEVTSVPQKNVPSAVVIYYVLCLVHFSAGQTLLRGA